MPRPRKQLPLSVGEGELRCRGRASPVSYEIRGEPATLKMGANRLHGSLTATADVAAEAFRAGEAELKLADGHQFRITLVGHTTGSAVAYFELRV